MPSIVISRRLIFLLIHLFLLVLRQELGTKQKEIMVQQSSNTVFDENSLNVIEVYINFLRKKIDKDFEPKLIHTKTGMGYVLKDE